MADCDSPAARTRFGRSGPSTDAPPSPRTTRPAALKMSNA
jgi:hypothetical protein